MKDSIASLRKQLQQLKARHDSGSLDDAAYAAAKAPLERQLLEHVMNAPADSAGPAAAGSGTDAPKPRPSWNLVGLSTVIVLIVAGSGYLWTGSPGLPSAGAPGSVTEAEAGPHAMDEAQFAAAVDKLAERLKNEPDSAEGWAILARSYARMGRHDEAIPAYAKAVALAPEDARLLADYADTVAMKNERSLEGEPSRLIERALKIEPDNAKALALAGTAAFNRKDYATAVRQWERLAQVAPPDAAFLPQLQSSVDEARSLAGMPAGKRLVAAAPAAAMAAAPATETAPTGQAPAGAAAAAVTGTVRLAPALAKQAAPDDVVFIFARPAEGSRMPLAIRRHLVKDLPLSFRLDDNMAMSPAAKMSLFPKLVIGARISKSGQAAPAPGDLTGQSAPVANNASGLVVEINEVVKN
ncbi:MAG: c-type cytochrome biogenesis protein CcmI [Leptothrix sp. (in: Bacteria)]|nr:c-type cytochrome biogenesis protein CcmI [Leptothrix sp. (in: b-proteobacteria)]